MSNCPFCRIVSGDASAYLLHEGERTLSFLDTSPVSCGHSLTVPKVHYEQLTDVPPDLVSELFVDTHRIANAIDSLLNPSGLNLIQSNGAAASQDVFHVHTHVIPRNDGDAMDIQWGHGNLDNECATELARDISELL